MKTLTLLRHAKSSWDDSVKRDFDRPINARGRRAASTMADYLAAQHFSCDLVLASPALRVRETLSSGAAALRGAWDIRFDERIYLASSATLIDVLRETDDAAQAVLMVGHNPGLEDLVLQLVPANADNPLRAEVEVKYPTAALAVMTLHVDHWRALRDGCAALTHFVRPRDLDPTLGPDAED